MATKKTGSRVAAKLTIPPDVKALLKDIENKKLLGGTSVDFYLKTAEDDLTSGDDVRGKLGADKLRHLATLVQSAAARKTAEATDWLSEKQFALAQRTAENAGQPSSADASAEPTEYDLKAQEAKKQAKILLQFQPTLLQAASGQSLPPFPSDPDLDDAGEDVEDTQESADLGTAADLLKDAQAHLGPTGTGGMNPALASAQAAVASALQHRGGSGNPMRVQMKRAEVPDTPDTPLWLKIRRSSIDLGWEKYNAFINSLIHPQKRRARAKEALTQSDASGGGHEPHPESRIRLPFPDCDPYRFLKAATEVFMMVNCETYQSNDYPSFDNVWTDEEKSSLTGGPSEADEDLAYAKRRLGRSYTAGQVEAAWKAYRVPADASQDEPTVLPYLALIQAKLGDQGLRGPQGPDDAKALLRCSGILTNKLVSPCLVELIWSYWLEEGMLVQTMNAISRRFQNIRAPGDRDPLASIEIDPLRPLNNVLWGYIQDEQHRLTVVRRAYEYDHQYGLALVGKAVPTVRGADTRTRFLEAFHNLLHLCTIFFKEDDDTTVIADGFPVLNALRDVHLVLTQGAHNQYGDLPWTARQEMLVQQWILARPEMREFIPTRIMVAYPEAWQDRVDAMKTLMGWTDTSVLHFSELGTYGERILLGARFNDWSKVIEPERAANWARFWRPEIQSYVHAYRAVTGIDLTERAQSAMPSTLLRQRLAMQRVAAR
jgi:hypothetical protein